MAEQTGPLLASARVLTAERINQPKGVAWQDETWDFYDTSGECSFATQWLSNALSRARLFAASPPTSEGEEPVKLDNGPAVDLVAEFGSGVQGQSRILAAMGVHLTIPGVGFVVGATEDEETNWNVYSNDGIRISKAQWEVRAGEKDWVPLVQDSLPIKVWRPHARKPWLPDSPTRHALPALREIQRCNEHIDACLVSRLAGAGLLLLPEEITFPTKPENRDKEDPFFWELLEVMRTPIKDRGSAAAIVPFPVRMKGEYIEKVRHLLFGTPLDDRVLELREKAIRRYATTVDFPAEILLGLGDINHWGQWHITEEGLKMHVEPFLELVVGAFTAGYLKPGLDALGRPDDEAIIWYDTSEIATRPDKSANAIELYDRGEIGPKTVIREVGLDESDALTDAELPTWAAKRLLSSPLTADAGLKLLGITSVDVNPPTPGQPVQLPAPGPAPTGPPADGQVPPAPPSATLLVAEQLVYRALEKAGNRARNLAKGSVPSDRDCPPVSMHECLGGVEHCGLQPAQLLDGAWERVADAAEGLGVDAAQFRDALDLYCTGLLVSGDAHSRDRLAASLMSGATLQASAVSASVDPSMSLALAMTDALAKLTAAMVENGRPHFTVEAPQVTVHPPHVTVEPPPPAAVHVDAPITVDARGARTRTIKRDDAGNIESITEED